jgi:hypothetical protein
MIQRYKEKLLIQKIKQKYFNYFSEDGDEDHEVKFNLQLGEVPRGTYK